MDDNDTIHAAGANDPEKVAALGQGADPYWYVGGIENAIDNLEMMSHFLDMSESPWRWKWVVIAAHQTLYSFLILALSKTAPSLAVTQPEGAGYAQLRSRMGWSLAQIAQSMSTPEKSVSEAAVEKLLKRKLKVIDIGEAMRRMTATTPNTGEPHNAEGNDYLPWSHSRRLVLSTDEEKAVTRLIETYRNPFEHFLPMSWSIDPAHFPPMLLHALRVIRFVALESHCIPFSREDKGKKVDALATKIHKQLTALLEQIPVAGTD